MMLMVRLHGIYTKENVFVRTSTQKGNILIKNRRCRVKSTGAKYIRVG